jgi:hypothetical protein
MESVTAPPVVEPKSASRATLDTYLRWTVAAFALTTAAIHFGFAPAHLAEDWAHGWFFLTVAWLQAAFAVLIVTRPRRWVWATGLVVNLGIVITWSVSRTAGLPFGPTALRKEPVGTPDLVCALLEGGIVLAAGVALLLPKLLERPVRERSFARLVAGSVALVAILGGSVSLTPAYAGTHIHSHDATSADGHVHAAAASIDGSTACEKAGAPVSPGQVATDAEGHSHRGPALMEPVSREDRVTLEAQQAQARTTLTRFPTVADAEKAGYRMSVVYVPCIGAHYTNVGLVLGFDPANPSELLYDGTNPDSKLVGLSYLVFHPGGPPEGFAGPNDRWHQHNVNGGLCFGKGGGVIGAEAMTPDECQAIGGQKRELTDIWMVHDWIVPGWECSWGVFAGECPDLGGRSGGTAWDAPDPAVTGQALGG